MSISDALSESARACEGAAFALAHVLRPAATKTDPPVSLLATYQEAQAFAITCRAVMDECTPIIPHLSSDSKCVGRFLGQSSTGMYVCNGYDTLAVILIVLLDNATQAILDVGANHSRWLVSPYQTNISMERMVTHHGQLRAFYGIMHLAAKILSNTTDISASLFVDPNKKKDSQMDPANLRAAIKLDDFYGRHFGFHYAPEMRNVLRVVNIFRGSVLKSHNDGDNAPQMLKNAFMLGWGWVYSNMVIMNNLGMNIDGVTQIGADTEPNALTIEQLRKYMNLVEEPLVAGVTGLASADVAIDNQFEIPLPGGTDGVEISVNVTNDPLRDVLASITDPVLVRLLSHKGRPTHLPPRRAKRNVVTPEKKNMNSTVKKEEGKCKDTNEQVAAGISSTDLAMIAADVEGLSFAQSASRTSTKSVTSEQSQVRLVSEKAHNNQPDRVKEKSPVPTKPEAVKVLDVDSMDNSFLASTIKTEFQRFQSNVSNLLGLEEKRAASGLIMHFHGGGFVSQSSKSHTVYLKEWCFDVQDAVILSVDYKLAPENQFPIALHECVYAYIWALQHASRIGTMAERIVFTGDSAGGNLAIATALKIAELGIRRVDGICVGYPALYVTSAWSPSRLLSFFDPLLPVSVLELCLKSYVPENVDGAQNAYISPLAATDEQLKGLPPVTIICGSLDPLLDDTAMIAQRLHNLRTGDVFRVYQSLPHGFLNMNQVNVNARKAVRFLAAMITKYLDLIPRKQAPDENVQESPKRQRNVENAQSSKQGE